MNQILAAIFLATNLAAVFPISSSVCYISTLSLPATRFFNGSTLLNPIYILLLF